MSLFIAYEFTVASGATGIDNDIVDAALPAHADGVRDMERMLLGRHGSKPNALTALSVRIINMIDLARNT